MKHDFVTHEMTSLYTHFGAYGRRGVHIHLCTRPSCNDVVLVGETISCGGKAAPHHFERLNEKAGEWELVVDEQTAPCVNKEAAR